MKLETANEIIACLPKERTLFHYFKDRYAFLLLGLASQHQCLNNSADNRFNRLLQKPAVRQWFGEQGKVNLHADSLKQHWVTDSNAFLLSLDTWDGTRGWGQTSRQEHNLVLQMGFSNEHESRYRRLVQDDDAQVFGFSMHPVMQRRKQHHRFRETLAWSRIDLSFEHNEALIEEVQSDWVSEVMSLRRDLLSPQGRERVQDWWCIDAPVEQIEQYCEYLMREYKPIWDQAMLSATLQFIVEELGITQVYYHSHETGKKVKQCNPPRSLYTQLPKQFCFEKTANAPQFLQENKRFKRVIKKVKQPEWYVLHFNGEQPEENHHA